MEDSSLEAGFCTDFGSRNQPPQLKISGVIDADGFISLSCQSLLPLCPRFQCWELHVNSKNPDLRNTFANEISILLYLSCINDTRNIEIGGMGERKKTTKHRWLLIAVGVVIRRRRLSVAGRCRS
jgi:hypothetical protein